MKYLLTCVLVLGLSGCFYQRADMADIKAAKEFCESLGSEVLYIDIEFLGLENVICVNGQSKTLHRKE